MLLDLKSFHVSVNGLNSAAMSLYSPVLHKIHVRLNVHAAFEKRRLFKPSDRAHTYYFVKQRFVLFVFFWRLKEQTYKKLSAEQESYQFAKEETALTSQ